MANIEKRESADGKVSYRVKVRLKGYPTQTATFERLTDARKWIAATETAIREGRHFKTAEAKRHTLGDAIDRYTRDVLPKRPKQVRVQTPHFAWWRDRIGERLLSDITPALLAECRDELTRDRAPATVVRYMAALSRLYSVAVKEWGWVDDTPMRKVEKPALPRGRVRFLSDDERAALLACCQESASPCLYTVVVLALSTGARKGEILGLRWGDVDLSRGRAVLRETKNGDTRAVHLTGHALELLRELSKVRRLDTDMLFPEKTRPGRKPAKPIDLRTPWENALKRAGIEDFRFHDLRHSAASYLAMNGATLAEIAEVLGHRSLAMVKRYSHLSDAHVSNVVERMNRKIFG